MRSASSSGLPLVSMEPTSVGMYLTVVGPAAAMIRAKAKRVYNRLGATKFNFQMGVAMCNGKTHGFSDDFELIQPR
jgi:hypothetical protein